MAYDGTSFSGRLNNAYFSSKASSAIAALILAFAPALAFAQADDKAALGDIKDVKVAFDVHEGDGKALLNRLNVIDETRQSLLKQGVTPHFVTAIRGPATKLVQTDVRSDARRGRERG